MQGQRFGRLVVLDRSGADGSGSAKWRCLCDCGAERLVSGASLRRGATQSCGCLGRELAAARRLKHGQSRVNQGRKGALYAVWQAMHQRCGNPAHPKFPRYGGRGIAVCARWSEYANFAADMGEKPAGRSLERKDNNGPYSPENCVWATTQEQARNRHNSVLVTIDGRTLCLSEWAREHGVHIATVQARIRRGMSAVEALAG
jgi:hypothetical protein